VSDFFEHSSEVEEGYDKIYARNVGGPPLREGGLLHFYELLKPGGKLLIVCKFATIEKEVLYLPDTAKRVGFEVTEQKVIPGSTFSHTVYPEVKYEDVPTAVVLLFKPPDQNKYYT